MPGPLHSRALRFEDALVAELLDDALAAPVHARHGASRDALPDSSASLRVLGVGGLQGSGKSTLAAQLAAAAQQRGVGSATLSLDDLYLDPQHRAALAQRVHPLFATRGPPGTHEVTLGCDVIDALRAGTPVALPRFDKARDRRRPVSEWPVCRDTHLLVIEGWCLCLPPQDDAALTAPANALERQHDHEGRWRRAVNDALAADYPQLWQRVDRLVWLQAPTFDVVPDWRWQQELARRRAEPDAPAVPREAIDHLIQHFERLSRHALLQMPPIADCVIALDAQHRPCPTPAR